MLKPEKTPRPAIFISGGVGEWLVRWLAVFCFHWQLKEAAELTVGREEDDPGLDQRRRGGERRGGVDDAENGQRRAAAVERLDQGGASEQNHGEAAQRELGAEAELAGLVEADAAVHVGLDLRGAAGGARG